MRESIMKGVNDQEKAFFCRAIGVQGILSRVVRLGACMYIRLYNCTSPSDNNACHIWLVVKILWCVNLLHVQYCNYKYYPTESNTVIQLD